MNQAPAKEMSQTLGQPRHFRTIFLSDVHLGTRGCQADKLLDFLRIYEADTIYLVGDIVDGWQLKSTWYWPQSHNDVVQKLLRKARKGTRVIYVPGNHDEFLREYYGSHFGGIEVIASAVHVTADGKRLLVIHGDLFDVVIRHARWLAMLGSHAYDIAIWLNTHFNKMRRIFGLGYWSLSRWAKLRVKNAVNFIGEFEGTLASEARRHKLDGVVCGHIHHPALRNENGLTYVNCGDWVESCTVAVEHFDGRLEIIEWSEQDAAPTPFQDDESNLVTFDGPGLPAFQMADIQVHANCHALVIKSTYQDREIRSSANGSAAGPTAAELLTWAAHCGTSKPMTTVTSEHTTKAFDVDLQSLSRMVAEMGGYAEQQLVQSIDALTKRNCEWAQRVVNTDETVDRLQHQIEEKAIATIATRQPLAVDLRDIVAILRIANELERIGDLAKNIGKRVSTLTGQEMPAKALRGVRHMATLAHGQLHDVLDAFASRDATKALAVWKRDQEIDAMYTSMFRELLTYMMEDPATITFGIHMLFCAKNLERMGDHATNIAEAVEYMVDGSAFPDSRPKADQTSGISAPDALPH